MIRRIIILLLLVWTSFACKYPELVEYNVPEQTQTVQHDCTKILKHVTYYWRTDSLANNGYRSVVEHRLRNCIIDSVSVDSVRYYLGDPSEVRTYLHPEDQFSYVYYTYNSNNMDSEKAGGFRPGIEGLILDFSSDTKKLLYIRVLRME